MKAMSMGCRPTIGQQCQYQGRPGEVRAIYPSLDGLAVVGRYLDLPGRADLEDGSGHFTAVFDRLLIKD